MELKHDREKNLQERLTFIRHYAAWVKSVRNEEWSRQQAGLIKSFMKSAKNFKMPREKYLEMVDRK